MYLMDWIWRLVCKKESKEKKTKMQTFRVFVLQLCVSALRNGAHVQLFAVVPPYDIRSRDIAAFGVALFNLQRKDRDFSAKVSGIFFFCAQTMADSCTVIFFGPLAILVAAPQRQRRQVCPVVAVRCAEPERAYRGRRQWPVFPLSATYSFNPLLPLYSALSVSCSSRVIDSEPSTTT